MYLFIPGTCTNIYINPVSRWEAFPQPPFQDLSKHWALRHAKQQKGALMDL